MEPPDLSTQMNWTLQKYELTKKIEQNLEAFVAVATASPAWLVNPANDIEQYMKTEYFQDVVQTLHVFVYLLNEEIFGYDGFEPLPISQPDPLHLALLLQDIRTAAGEIMVELNKFSMYLLSRDYTSKQLTAKRAVLKVLDRVQLESAQAVLAMSKWNDLALRKAWARIHILYRGFGKISF